MELHADALAGYYIGKKVGSASASLGVLQKELIKDGTYNNKDYRYHGTPGQRNAALDKGYLLALEGFTFAAAADVAEKYVKNLV